MNKPRHHDPSNTARFNTAFRQEILNIDDGRLPDNGNNIVIHDATAPRNGDGHDYRHLSDACKFLGEEDMSELRHADRKSDGTESFIPDVRESIADLNLYLAAMETYGDRRQDDPETLLTMRDMDAAE